MFSNKGFIFLIIILVIVTIVRFYRKYRERFEAFNRLRVQNADIINKYIDSYNVLYNNKNDLQVNSLDDFNNNLSLVGYKINNQWEYTENLYIIVHDLCRLGGLKKMYIPPQLDETNDIHSNQLLVEKKIGEYLKVQPNEKLLEIGCGCGAIAEHMSNNTLCHVTGINIDKETIQKGMDELALKKNNNVNLVYADMNEKLPFDDNSFDGVYNIQAMTFSNNLESLFKEINRVLKPGKRMVIMDGMILDNFDKKNPKDIERFIETQKVCCGGGWWHPKYWENAGEKAGFKVITSTCGDKYKGQYANELPILIEADNYYHRIKIVTKILAKCRILPEHIPKLLERMCEGSAGLIELCKENKLTTNYFIIFEKQ